MAQNTIYEGRDGEMPEYRRFIAYFYEYINGSRQNNAGFAKVELRNGMWRILFRLTDCAPEPPQQVYGFVREDGWLLGLLMGTIRQGGGMMEEWAYRADTPVWERKYGFADLAGIWIQTGDGRCYVTVWDDEPIDMERFVLQLPEQKSIERLNAEKWNTESQDTEKQDIEKQKKDAGLNAAEIELKEEIREANSAEHEAVWEESQDAADIEVPEKNSDIFRIAEETRTEIGAELMPQVSGQTETAVSALWKELTRERQGFEPFDDAEFKNCIQITAADIMTLQQAGCQIGRSTFLLHGFYQYHHLLLAQKEGDNLVIGVPGLVNPQERYMAQMFGYGTFKTARWSDRGKQFGYWYRPLMEA